MLAFFLDSSNDHIFPLQFSFRLGTLSYHMVEVIDSKFCPLSSKNSYRYFS